MSGNVESEALGITDRDIASMKRLRRREATSRLVRGVLSSTIGFLAGLVPAVALVLHSANTSSSYPFASALAVGAIASRESREQPKLLLVISFPFLLIFALIGAGVNLILLDYYGNYTLYGVYDGR